MSDSVRLWYERAMWCLVFSYVALAVFVSSCFLIVFISPGFAFLFLFSLLAFGILICAFLDNLSEVIKLSKKDGAKKNTISFNEE